MELSILVVLVFVVIAIAIKIYDFRKSPEQHIKPKITYKYARKRYVMTMSENEFYRTLQEAIGTSYMIYPQAHLDLFLDHKVKGQNWKGALSTIQRKSVDFLICNREYYNPLVAIELDDSTHERPDRVERDKLVEAACSVADMPLVRFQVASNYSPNDLLDRLAPYLK